MIWKHIGRVRTWVGEGGGEIKVCLFCQHTIEAPKLDSRSASTNEDGSAFTDNCLGLTFRRG